MEVNHLLTLLKYQSTNDRSFQERYQPSDNNIKIEFEEEDKPTTLVLQPQQQEYLFPFEYHDCCSVDLNRFSPLPLCFDILSPISSNVNTEHFNANPSEVLSNLHLSVLLAFHLQAIMLLDNEATIPKGERDRETEKHEFIILVMAAD